MLKPNECKEPLRSDWRETIVCQTMADRKMVFTFGSRLDGMTRVHAWDTRRGGRVGMLHGGPGENAEVEVLTRT